MKVFAISILLYIVLLVCIQACNIFDPDSGSTGTGTNLLKNSSFEIPGSPSIASWDTANSETDRYFFSTDVPPATGVYSLGLRITPFVPFWVGQTLVLPEGISKGLRLTFCVKTDSFPGYLYLGVMRADTMVIDTTIVPRDLQWKYYTVDLGYNAQAGDSVGVFLHSQWRLSSDTTYWDQVCLYGLN